MMMICTTCGRYVCEAQKKSETWHTKKQCKVVKTVWCLEKKNEIFSQSPYIKKVGGLGRGLPESEVKKKEQAKRVYVDNKSKYVCIYIYILSKD